ncbi:DUF2147 domain-containing protein [Chitinimonas sp.]|uniref:DUF2147 domain-containing protein n=1 Tax=Chitinimonas sp. TaxID=1934313 RepID=UPI002F93BE5F
MHLARLFLPSLMALGMAAAQADALSPVGNWKNISDKTKKVEAVIQIWEEGGEYKGKLVKLFDSKETTCSACKGDKQNKPLLGLEIIWGVKKDGDEWNGGKILDPNSGDIYSVKMSLAEGGQQLKVRGFMGFSLLGRTQIWLRDQ